VQMGPAPLTLICPLSGTRPTVRLQTEPQNVHLFSDSAGSHNATVPVPLPFTLRMLLNRRFFFFFFFPPSLEHRLLWYEQRVYVVSVHHATCFLSFLTVLHHCPRFL